MDSYFPDSPESVFRSNEGRRWESSRRATYVLLFNREGRPRAWLVALGVIWAVVVGVALGTPA